MGSRRQARERAIQVLFQWDIHGASDYWLDDFWTQHPSSPEERKFVERIVDSVRDHRDELDELIARHATNWKVSRMPIVDRSILRAALSELLWMPDVPAKVTVNEAIELAKEFADDETKRFVNGILDQILKDDPRLQVKRMELAAGTTG
jgi:N utilization substance protein B